MRLEFAQPGWLLAFALGVGWVLWFARRSDAPLSRGRRVAVVCLRVLILACLVGALAGAQWLRSQDGLSVFFLLDRSDSIPPGQQEAARDWVQKVVRSKPAKDRAGVVVFGAEASIERTAGSALNLQKVFAVVDSQRTDIASAVRLAAAASPEQGQRRIVVISDGNENLGDALAAVEAAVPLGVSVDVVPLGIGRSGDVSLQRVALPGRLKVGQTFDLKVFVESDHATPATLRVLRDDAVLGEQTVEIAAGKNLFSVPQTLSQPAFYRYEVQVEAKGDPFPQNNRAIASAEVRGDPRLLLVSMNPAEDAALIAALKASKMEVRVVDPRGFPTDLAELQSFDSILLSNVSAGDLGQTLMKFIESAVRDFGIGLVCIGGDQTYAAGSYRGTPLEEVLPVDMELNSKKVLPSGALALVMHGMEFANGNQVARQTALGVLDALGPTDELGVVLWDGVDRWLFPLTKVGDRKALGGMIAGMNQGDLPSFENVVKMAAEGLRQSTAGLKHIIVFSDGDPAAPSAALMEQVVAQRITVSSVLIAGHSGPETMREIAERGRGRFYNVTSASQLPQIFIKEAAVVLKSAIFEEPFKPKLATSTELVRGIAPAEYPTLRGYVAANVKSRAEAPLVSDKGDPVLAHWQFGLGRAVAFTSDAKARWASDWLQWVRFRQFWSQVVQWSLRRIDSSDLDARFEIEKGDGILSVEAVAPDGNYRNFLNLQAVVVGPSGDRQTVPLVQRGPGRYEARVATKEVGGYLVNLMELQDGRLRGAQVLGASVNYSPEFGNTQPNRSGLRRLADAGHGQELSIRDAERTPFNHDRVRTTQAFELWEWLLRAAVVLFPIDVALRRVQIDAEEWARLTASLRRWIGFRSKQAVASESESLSSLLARRDEVRDRRLTPMDRAGVPDLRTGAPPGVEPVASEAAAPFSAEVVVKSPSVPVEDARTQRLLEAKRKARKHR